MNPQKNRSSGFTLIELLTVVSIIGVLSVIAIPQFSLYKQRGFDARSLHDLKDAATAEDAYFAVHHSYVDCIGTAACQAVLPGFTGSPGTTVSMVQIPAAGAVPSFFTGSAYHPNGERNSMATAWLWNSNRGGLQ